jgi:hypothetical protein
MSTYKTLDDFVGHTLIGQGYHDYLPSRALIATVVGVTRDHDQLIVTIDDDDVQTTCTVAPLDDEELDFGSSPLLGDDPETGWELDLDFWE